MSHTLVNLLDTWTPHSQRVILVLSQRTKVTLQNTVRLSILGSAVRHSSQLLHDRHGVTVYEVGAHE